MTLAYLSCLTECRHEDTEVYIKNVCCLYSVLYLFYFNVYIDNPFDTSLYTQVNSSYFILFDNSTSNQSSPLCDMKCPHIIHLYWRQLLIIFCLFTS